MFSPDFVHGILPNMVLTNRSGPIANCWLKEGT